jgi:hypothetical protein
LAPSGSPLGLLGGPEEQSAFVPRPSAFGRRPTVPRWDRDSSLWLVSCSALLGRGNRWFFSSDAQDSPCHDDLARNPRRNKQPLQEPGPPVERRTCVNGEEADDNE